MAPEIEAKLDSFGTPSRNYVQSRGQNCYWKLLHFGPPHFTDLLPKTVSQMKPPFEHHVAARKCERPKKGVEMGLPINTLHRPTSPLNLTTVVHFACVRIPWPSLKGTSISHRFGRHLFWANLNLGAKGASKWGSHFRATVHARAPPNETPFWEPLATKF